MSVKKLYIDGEWVEGSEGKTFFSTNPATGEVIAEIAQASVEDAKRAIAAAKKSFYVTREWRDMDSQARGDMILKIADAIEKNKDVHLFKEKGIDYIKATRERLKEAWISMDAFIKATVARENIILELEKELNNEQCLCQKERKIVGN